MSNSFFTRDRRASGWMQIDQRLVDLYLPKIGVVAFVVYCILVKHSRLTTPAIDADLISREARIGVTEVEYALHSLLGFGLIEEREDPRTLCLCDVPDDPQHWPIQRAKLLQFPGGGA